MLTAFVHFPEIIVRNVIIYLQIQYVGTVTLLLCPICTLKIKPKYLKYDFFPLSLVYVP